jgi:hypothetical protein
MKYHVNKFRVVTKTMFNRLKKLKPILLSKSLIYFFTARGGKKTLNKTHLVKWNSFTLKIIFWIVKI